MENNTPIWSGGEPTTISCALMHRCEWHWRSREHEVARWWRNTTGSEHRRWQPAELIDDGQHAKCSLALCLRLPLECYSSQMHLQEHGVRRVVKGHQKKLDGAPLLGEIACPDRPMTKKSAQCGCAEASRILHHIQSEYHSKMNYTQSMTEALGRRERKKRETRQAIAAAALRLFTERGFEHITIAEIAEAADVSVNTVFNYFPTKEALFFSQHQPMEAGLAQLIRTRKHGEPLITFLRRHLLASLEHFLVRAPVHQQVGLETGQMIQRSPALQAHAAQLAQQIEQDLAQALAQEMKAGPNDITPRLVASQVLALYATLFAEGERRRLAGQTPEEISTALQASAMTGLNLLEHGIGRYGSQP